MESLTKLIANIEKVIIGKRDVVELAVTCMIANGHLLIEDIPGTGKTTLAMAIARSIEANFSRIQFTADLLPTDVTGLSIYNQEKHEFDFKPGPIFNHIVLSDEINRGTPRVQSGLLEAMNEYQVSVDGTTYPLPKPFFVIATQNPLTFAGTYPLLIAQLDRFLLKIKIGYLSAEEEIKMIKQQKLTHPVENLDSVMSLQEMLSLQEKAKYIKVDEAIYKYIISLANATRESPELQYGISHRGTLALFKAIRAYALVQGRDYVIPDDVKKLATATLAHRLVKTTSSRGQNFAEQLIEDLLSTIPIPL